ncbi:glycosyltransferase family 4 protein [Sphingobium algorifonticola]|uniref:Glycosyltransferase family 1 protein n=1 Tax=Sphingobium algorifonticola TaxID=2008318 RepID=A0A437J4Y0_9SPHN|nr:glycosyltransferase family 1 protein [Sphingobium algorifonticola]RVT39821.1 glycosyltransferase family 1 protein [Sphingobium algorifonticola]
MHVKVIIKRIRKLFGMIAVSDDNLIDKNKNSILIDISTINKYDAGTGIQRVVRSVVSNLLSMNLEKFIVRTIISNGRINYIYNQLHSLSNIDRKFNQVNNEKVIARPGDMFLGIDLSPKDILRNKGQIIRWKSAGVRIVFFVYDLLPARNPDWFHRTTSRRYLKWLNFVVDHADHVICISRTVADDFALWIAQNRPGNANGPDIGVIRLGSDFTTSMRTTTMPDNAEKIFSWMRAKRTVLMVGTIEPRKGYDQALKAFDLIWQNDQDNAPHLLIVGRPGWKSALLQAKIRNHVCYGKSLLWLEDASDTFLAALYQKCAGLLLASRGEGFGLPMLEAKAYGKSVLVRDLPVFREVARGSATFFHGEEPEDLANAINGWLATIDVNKQEAEDATQAGNWQTTANDILTMLGVLDSTNNKTV